MVILSMFQKEAYAHQALAAGAQGYILKGAPSAELLEAIRAVHTGRFYLSHPMQAKVIDSYVRNREQKTSTSDFDLLSEREKQVFLLLIEGNSTVQISKLLCVSVKTIEKHRANISQKIGISNPVGMMKYAIRLESSIPNPGATESTPPFPPFSPVPAPLPLFGSSPDFPVPSPSVTDVPFSPERVLRSLFSLGTGCHPSGPSS